MLLKAQRLLIYHYVRAQKLLLHIPTTQAPQSMKSIMQAAWQLTVAGGNIIVIIIAEGRFFSEQVCTLVMYFCMIVIIIILFLYNSLQNSSFLLLLSYSLLWCLVLCPVSTRIEMTGRRNRARTTRRRWSLLESWRTRSTHSWTVQSRTLTDLPKWRNPYNRVPLLIVTCDKDHNKVYSFSASCVQCVCVQYVCTVCVCVQ